MKTFFLFYQEKKVNDIDNEDVVRFHGEYIIKRNLSSSFQNQIINAVKLYFSTIKETAIRWKKSIDPKAKDYCPMY